MKFPVNASFEDAGMRGESRIFMLTKSFWYDSRIGWIEVPRGFRTDGASVPRIFWSILSPFGCYFPAALIHDFLYSMASGWHIDRALADQIFLDAMQDIGVSWLTRHTIYRAVRLAGWITYKKSPLNLDLKITP